MSTVHKARNINKALQKALVFLRKEKGLTQIDIAQKLGRPQSFVSKYETGERRLTVGDFVVVCEALGIKPSLLIQNLKN